MKTEFEVGEVFQCGLIKLKCVEQGAPHVVYPCKGCVFKFFDEDSCSFIIGECSKDIREDKKDVIFVKEEDNS